MDQLWAQSAFPEHRPHVVLRLKLRPLSAGHEILLSSINSPFAIGGPLETKDLLTAVLICAAKFRDAVKLLRSPRRAKLFTSLWRLCFLFRPTSKLSVERSTLNVPPPPKQSADTPDWPAELEAFNAYLLAGRWAPPTAQRHGAGWSSRELKAPRPWRLVHFLCSHMGLSEAEALDFPLARAAAYFATHADLEGSMDLQGGQNENALLEHLANLEARAAAGEPVWD